MAEGTETRMSDIDGNFCDGNGRLLPQTGEEWQDKLRRERDQPKKQELPPLDERYVELTADLDGSEDIDADVRVRLALDCREDQLRAALSDNEALRADNEAKDARIAEQERLAAYADTLYRGQVERDGARIAEIPLLDQLLDKRATEIESLRAKLKSVEGMLEGLHPDPMVLKLRAIVEGKC